jgi:hypothetical protein
MTVLGQVLPTAPLASQLRKLFSITLNFVTTLFLTLLRTVPLPEVPAKT